MKLPQRSVGLAPAERRTVESALTEAFGPLGARAAPVGPARIRAAVRWAPRDRPPERLRGLGLLARLGELSVAAAVSAFLFAGVVASSLEPSPPDVSRDAATAAERTLNGRIADQHPISSGAMDYLTALSDDVMNGAAARRREVGEPSRSHDHDGLSLKP